MSSGSAMKRPIRSALKHLHKYGSEALLPQKPTNPNTKRWIKPKVSRRVANDLRKKAIREGTFGSYDPLTGVGWDPSWDYTPATANDNDMNTMEGTRIMGGGTKIPWMQIRPPKETKRERTREARALKIEALLQESDEKIAEYKLELEKKKPEPGIENLIKTIIAQSSK